MFYGRRIKELEERLEKLEDATRIVSATETEPIYFFGMIERRPKPVPMNEVIHAILAHLGLRVESEPKRLDLKKTPKIKSNWK